MRDADNDNDPLPFQTLAAPTAKWLRRYKINPGGDAGVSDAKQNTENESEHAAHENYVKHRLRDLAEFEARARGDRKRS